jgi:hypothetical protein
MMDSETMFDSDVSLDKGYAGEARDELTTHDDATDADGLALGESEKLAKHDGKTSADGTQEALGQYDLTDATGESDASHAPARSGNGDEGDADTFDPFAGMDESERYDDDPRDPMNPFENGLLDDEGDDEGDDARRDADTGTRPVEAEVIDTSAATHHDQPIRIGVERLSRVAASENPPTDARFGGPGRTLQTPDGILDVNTEFEGVGVSEEIAEARQAEINQTHYREPGNPRAETNREQVVGMEVGEDFDNDGHAPAPALSPVYWADEDAELQANVPLGELDDDTQEEAAKESLRLASANTQFGPYAVQKALGKRLRMGMDLSSAFVDLMGELKKHPDGPVPIHLLGKQDDYRVDVVGEVVQLWNNDDDDIRQVGLLADPTKDDGETIKFTVWQSATQSGMTNDYDEPGFPERWVAGWQGHVEEGDEVVLTNVKQELDHNYVPCLEVDRRSNEVGGRKPITIV